MGVDRLKRAVFFDRDGVLNETIVRDGIPLPPPSLAALRLIPGAHAVVTTLRDLGFVAIVVTNQPDVARGHTPRGTAEAINAAVHTDLGLDAMYSCFHDDRDECDCRKPKPGLLLRAARDHGVDLAASYLIGDRWKDVASGRAAGCTTIFIDFAYEETPAATGADFTVSSLDEALACILARESIPR